MSSDVRSLALDALPWTEVARHLERDTRLILPVGTCDQHGPHLPIGAGTRLAEALARDLSEEFGVLRAPTLHYGVNLPTPRAMAGAATLRSKTLHRALNELLAVWRTQGFQEFIVISGEAHDPHVESVAAASAEGARVRVVEPLTVNLSEFLDGPHGAQHGGEILTSLLLHLHPALVRMEAAEDFSLPAIGRRLARDGRLAALPEGSPGLVGFPSRASAEKGERMYRHIREKIRHKVFISPPAQPIDD
ncbi:MAG: creatininase family protein [Gemmatimonadota bacterium]|jgi:creatinine amidohydrolase|nr:creatininase family protein [Gemmatimonadota bacterium]